MRSKIYFGQIEHQRLIPKPHSFKYSICMFYIDLDELNSLFDKRWFWSVNKRNIASFNDENYLGGTKSPGIASEYNVSEKHEAEKNSSSVKQSVIEEIKNKFGVKHTGPVRMLTHLKYFGYCFNPVTFYYCFNSENDNVDFLLAQINNTPWDERYVYAFDNRNQQLHTNSPSVLSMNFQKNFHVSPFLPMNMNCSWKFKVPKENLSVYMNNKKNDELYFQASLNLKAEKIEGISLAKVLFRYPFMTMKVTLAIYWQALKLWLKKIPFYENPTTSNVNKQVRDS